MSRTDCYLYFVGNTAESDMAPIATDVTAAWSVSLSDCLSHSGPLLCTLNEKLFGRDTSVVPSSIVLYSWSPIGRGDLGSAPPVKFALRIVAKPL